MCQCKLLSVLMIIFSICANTNNTLHNLHCRHMLFTGVTCDLLNLVQRIMAKAKRKTKFNESFSIILHQLSSLKLEWMKCGVLPDSQWASENYVAIARIFSFLIGYYCHHFDPYKGGITYNDIVLLQRLVNSFQMMIASLMRVDEKVTTDELDRNIKIFLSCWNHVEGAFEKILSATNNSGGDDNGEGNGIFTKGNFLSLLNIPEQVSYFGPLRLFWEGNSEFYIQKIKKELDHVRFSLSFFERKLKRHQQSERLAFLRKQVKGTAEENKDWQGKRFHRYKSVDEVDAVLQAGNVLSVIRFADSGESLFVSVGRNRDGKTKFVRISADVSCGISEICGLLYCEFRLDKDERSTVVFDDAAKLEERLLSAEYGVLLSFGGNNHPGHTLITDEWKTINGSGHLDFPVISTSLFSNE